MMVAAGCRGGRVVCRIICEGLPCWPYSACLRQQSPRQNVTAKHKQAQEDSRTYPHEKTSPASVTATEWLAPQAADITGDGTASMDRTSVACRRSEVEPWPS